MTLHFHSAVKFDYPFLAHPPPQRKRPHQPLPATPLDPIPAQAACGPRRRSSTFSAIAAWAAHVQPGSPTSTSPCSPHRRPSLGRGRCSSVASVGLPSASFLHIAPTPTTAQPTPSIRDFKADLTTVGYASVFLQLSTTPVSATLPLAIKPPSPGLAKNIPIPPVSPLPRKPHSLARFRSLSILRPRGRSKSGPDSPTKMKAKAAATSAAVIKRKKAKYAARPPPLANELALMQFADGGNLDDNIGRIMEAQAKVAGAAGLADVHRDGEGGIWWDQDEEWEYTHLLAEGNQSRTHVSGDLQWVTFGTNPTDMSEDERRGSISTQDSDLDPKYIVQPADPFDGDDLVVFGSAVVPPAASRPTTSILTLPSRPRRAAKHLRKPDSLLDVAFSRSNASPKRPKSPTMPGAIVGMSKSRGNARRRPAPLKLFPPSPAFKRPTNSPIDADKVRRDFLQASFEPVVPVTPVMAISLTTPVDAYAKPGGNSRTINAPWRTVNGGLASLGIKRKQSKLNVIGLFRATKKDSVC